jgi:hypothetical protein
LRCQFVYRSNGLLAFSHLLLLLLLLLQLGSQLQQTDQLEKIISHCTQ